MNILFHGNCQGVGLKWFMERSPDADKLHIGAVENYKVILGETTHEQEAEATRHADVIFFHRIQGKEPWRVEPKKGARLIPLSVFYNGGIFISHAERASWEPILEIAREQDVKAAAHYATHHADMGYRDRFEDNLARMIEKEEQEGVPPFLRASHMAPHGITERQCLTMNHPSSMVFFRWAEMLLHFLGLRGCGEEVKREAMNNPNVVGLPCEDFVCPGAVKHLDLAYGGGDYETGRAEEAAAQRIRDLTLQGVS